METRKGLATKLVLYSAGAVVLVVYGKKHIARHKEERYLKENDFSLETDDEFVDSTTFRGFPTNNPGLNYEGQGRESKYIGNGQAYSSRTPGDRLSVWNVFKQKSSGKDEEK
ncbi:hypothetical protein FT663_03204 [Candidozyma haemuli var. vulneris]|uniref:Uncharacterized protein n=1 Tax=Candidozyma haemuli TaxID=45357 RepID=A0A2V1AWV5_9ASCO|nr:hypothetical protein CXQ85_004661 [[Candida] haemuloni]KAF3988731.1 hypothetical protein FT662_03259 [[Candida] haemuloni var. vulneris]KAF3990351.1 hypothetical protein FT663_03204 [[Candida] haemuloni var. vulneris]PVH21996.1 hypothetical protein CXQ85_004661 [[Candida] haemuloni]